MKKSICIFLALILLTGVIFTGCGAASTAGKPTDAPKQESQGPSADQNAKIVVTPQMIGNENAKIGISWQPVPAHSLADSNKNKVDYLTKKATEWAEKHPDVKINIADSSVSINDAMAKILVQLASGQSVDMSAIDSYIFPRFAKYAQPIDDVMKDKNLDIGDWFPFAQKVMKPEDKVLGFWYTTDVRMLFYRKDLVKTPPKTWDEVLALGGQLKGQGLDTFLYSAGRDENVTMNTLPYFWGQGGELVDDSGKPVFGEGKNREAMINYFTFLKETVSSGTTPSRVLNFKTDPNMNTDLASGKVAMFVGVSNMAAQLRSVIGAEKFDELWEAAPIPMAKADQRMTAAGGWISTVFTRDDAKRKLAADFLASMYVDDSGMEGWCTAGGYLPPRKSIFDKAEVFKTDKFAQKFKEELQYARVRPAATIYPDISQEIQIGVSKVLDGSATPEKAVDDAWQNILNKK